MALADWMQHYPGVAQFVQQEGDVLEGVSQEAKRPAPAPRSLWATLPSRAAQGYGVRLPQRCGCQCPNVCGHEEGSTGGLCHATCTCAWQLIVIRELRHLPPLQRGLWVQRLSGRYQQVTLVRSGGACRACDHTVSLRRFLQRLGARLVDPASWVTLL